MLKFKLIADIQVDKDFDANNREEDEDGYYGQEGKTLMPIMEKKVKAPLLFLNKYLHSSSSLFQILMGKIWVRVPTEREIGLSYHTHELCVISLG